MEIATVAVIRVTKYISIVHLGDLLADVQSEADTLGVDLFAGFQETK